MAQLRLGAFQSSPPREAYLRRMRCIAHMYTRAPDDGRSPQERNAPPYTGTGTASHPTLDIETQVVPVGTCPEATGPAASVPGQLMLRTSTGMSALSYLSNRCEIPADAQDLEKVLIHGKIHATQHHHRHLEIL